MGNVEAESDTQGVSRAAEPPPLDEVMVAMDVVDTLRHRELLVERELNAEERERGLIERLREIYAAQGIEVSDAALAQGVRALREERFTYKPPPPGLSVSLARLYIRRGKVAKAALALLAVVALAWGGYTFLIKGPAEQRLAALPKTLEARYRTVVELSQVDEIDAQAQRLAESGRAALGAGNTEGVQTAIAKLEELRARLDRSFELRIVSRPGERSGVWRIPERNPNARNYYLIVEAVTPDGAVLTLPIRNEEDGRIYRVSKWGLRVGEETFRKVAADKDDDGIIQDNRLGVKRRGYLEPEYFMPTTGAAITSW